MPQLSEQLRERIVAWRFTDGKEISEIAQLAGCSERSIYNVLRMHREYGHMPNPRTQGHPRALDIGDVNYIVSLLDANPALYLDELQELLEGNRGIKVSLSTLSRTLRRAALTHKHVARAAFERNKLLRATWQAANGEFPMEYFVWLDEASVDDRTNQRDGGWAALGRACVRRAAFLRGQRFSVLPALTCDGIIAMDIFEGAVNKERFVQFLEQQLVCPNLLLSQKLTDRHLRCQN